MQPSSARRALAAVALIFAIVVASAQPGVGSSPPGPHPNVQTAANHAAAGLIFAWVAHAHPKPVRAASPARHTGTTRISSHPVNPGSDGACGGSLPPCYVLARESGGNLRVWNGGCYEPTGWTGPPCGRSTASGKWQILRSTWAGFGGYVNAADAPAAVQDAKARLLWAGGRGCSHWSAC